MPFKIGEIVKYNGILCEVARFAGSMKVSDGIMYKYDLWNISGKFIYDSVSHVEITAL